MEGPILTTVRIFYLQNHTPGQWHCLLHRGAMLIPSSQIMTGLFFLLDSSLPSLPVTRETQNIPISIRCGSGAPEPVIFGLWEVSWVLHAPYWRHSGTCLIATWVAHSFLFDLGEVWARNAVFKVLAFHYMSIKSMDPFGKRLQDELTKRKRWHIFCYLHVTAWGWILAKNETGSKKSFWQVTFLSIEMQNLLQMYAATFLT